MNSSITSPLNRTRARAAPLGALAVLPDAEAVEVVGDEDVLLELVAVGLVRARRGLELLAQLRLDEVLGLVLDGEVEVGHARAHPGARRGIISGSFRGGFFSCLLYTSPSPRD